MENDLITGIDEAGRGCLAGPVVVAAVTWPQGLALPVADSKTLTALQREILFEKIIKHALAYSYIAVDNQYIDQVNIRQATLYGMSRSYHALPIQGQTLIIDGIDKPLDLSNAQPIIKADQTIPAVSAASIIAKVVRDRMMKWYHTMYPLYAFDEHKGYGTVQHRAAIAQHGPCKLHRLSYTLLAQPK